ncbi:ADP-ribosylation factor 3 [Octopus vulgaris]|uniref:ADP-ribosylation factor 3 n=1 Tax=Octopus vulgaris TaxID=6645 RepID=A0AA36ALJ8_OCTVU|nr:ADP-ribosylation factor 3 [Octopus vulgaris]
MWKGIRPFVAMVITAGLSIIAGYTFYVLKRRSRDDKKADETCSLPEKETSDEPIEKEVEVDDGDSVTTVNKQLQSEEQIKQNASVKTTRIDDHNKKRVLVLGVEKAGKTTFISAMSNQLSSEKYAPTQGFSVVTTSVGEKALNFWEVGGAPNLRPHWGRYIDGTNLLLYVIDSTDAKLVDLAKDELNKLVKANQYLDTIPWLIIASKQDLLGAMSPDEIRELLNIPQVPKQPEKIVIGMELPAKGLKKGISKVKSFLTETAF